MSGFSTVGAAGAGGAASARVSVDKLEPPEKKTRAEKFNAENNFEGFASEVYGELRIEGEYLILSANNPYGVALHREVDKLATSARVEAKMSAIECDFNFISLALIYGNSVVYGAGCGYSPQLNGWFYMIGLGGEENVEILLLDGPVEDVVISVEIVDGKIRVCVNDVVREVESDIPVFEEAGFSCYALDQSGKLAGDIFKIKEYVESSIRIEAPYFVVGKPQVINITNLETFGPSYRWRRIFTATGYGIAVITCKWGTWPPGYVIRCDGEDVAAVDSAYNTSEAVMFREKIEIYIPDTEHGGQCPVMNMYYVGYIFAYRKEPIQ